MSTLLQLLMNVFRLFRKSQPPPAHLVALPSPPSDNDRTQKYYTRNSDPIIKADSGVPSYSLSKDTDDIQDEVFYYVAPIKLTIDHPDYSRREITSEDRLKDKMCTMAFAESRPICCPRVLEDNRVSDNVCIGCVRCKSFKCAWCNELLIKNSCKFQETIFESVTASMCHLRFPKTTRFYYEIQFLVTFPSRYLIVTCDQTMVVCSECVHSCIASDNAICHDPDTMANLYRFYCVKIEDKFSVGKFSREKIGDRIELFRMHNGNYVKLSKRDTIKVLEICRNQDPEEDQLVSYGPLESDQVEDTHIASPKEDLTISGIAKLVVDCSKSQV